VKVAGGGKGRKPGAFLRRERTKRKRALEPVDYHIHTAFSADSEMEPLALCERAVALGYGETGFAEHVDFFPGDRGFGYFDARAYGRAVAEMQARFVGRLTIRKGVEVDFQERCLDDIARFLSGEEFDFVIGAVHWLDGCFIDEAGLTARPLEEAYRIYERETRALVGAGMFDILGHLDYIRRRAVGHYDPARVEAFAPMMADLAAEAARAGLLLEVNVQRGRLPLPTVESLRAYLGAGGQGVTVGTDSHSLEQFEGGWERTRAYLEEAGLREVTLFRGRERRAVAL
jgi:histidinol-phosphatase (PHP family)